MEHLDFVQYRQILHHIVMYDFIQHWPKLSSELMYLNFQQAKTGFRTRPCQI